MKRFGGRTALSLALFGLLALEFGCTGSDDIVSGSGNLSLEVVNTPTDLGRYELGLITLIQITVRPSDSSGNAALGSTPLGLLTSNLSLSLQNDSPTVAIGLPLSDGDYILDSVLLENPTLTDSDAAANLPPVPDCFDLLLASTRPGVNGTIPTPEIVQQVKQTNNRIKLGPFSPPIVLHIPRGTNQTLHMLIHGPILSAIFQASFVCQSTGRCPNGNVAAPCLSAFTAIPQAQAKLAFEFE